MFAVKAGSRPHPWRRPRYTRPSDRPRKLLSRRSKLFVRAFRRWSEGGCMSSASRKYWWLVGVVVPLLVALIGLTPWIVSEIRASRSGEPPASSIGHDQMTADQPAAPVVKKDTGTGDTETAEEPRLPAHVREPGSNQSTATNAESENRSTEPQTEFTVTEGQPRHVVYAQSTVGVSFQHLGGEAFVTIQIFPEGEAPITRAAVGSGVAIEFTSAGRAFRAVIVDIRYPPKEVVMRVVPRAL